MIGPVLARWARYAAWLRRTGSVGPRRVRQRGRLDRRRRLRAVALLGVILAVAPVVASAADGAPMRFLDAFAVTDTHGLTVTDYELNLEDGGLTGFRKNVSAWLAVSGWDVYRTYVGIGVWLLSVATSFMWLDAVRGPLETVAMALQNVIDQIGIVPLLLTVAVLVTATWWWKGRYGAALGEIAVSLVLASLVTGVLANPVAFISGDDGAITRAQQFGTELSARVVTGSVGPEPAWEVPDQPPPEAASAEERDAELQHETSAALLELFVRTPHQIINYGTKLDGVDTACANVYDDVLAEGPWGEDSAPRDRMGGCNEAYGEAAKDPQGAWLAAFFIGPSSVFLVLLMLVLVGSLLALSVLAMWEAARLILELVKGIVPGAGRTGMWECVCSLLVAVALIAGVLVFIGAYLQVLRGIFSTTTDWHPAQIFIIVDLLLAVAGILLIGWTMRARRSGRRFGQRAAKATSPRPAAMPRETSVKPVLAAGMHAAATAGSLARRHTPSTGGRTPAPVGPQAGRPPPTGSPGQPDGDPASGPGTSSRPAASGARHAAQLSTPAKGGAVRTTGKVAWKASKLAMASTVGLPVYGPRAATQAAAMAAARKTAMRAKLTAAQQRAGTAVRGRTDTARSFGHEYAHNVATGARAVAKYSGAAHLAGALTDATVAPGVAAAIAAGVTGRDTRHDPAGSQRFPAAHASAGPAPVPAPAGHPPRANERPDTFPGGPDRSAGPATRSDTDAPAPSVPVSPRERLRARLDAAQSRSGR